MTAVSSPQTAVLPDSERSTSLEIERTERVLLGTFLAIRSLHIALGAVHLILEPRGFRRRWLGWAGLGLSAASTAVVAKRIGASSGAADPLAVICDTGAHLVAVRLADAALLDDHGTGSSNVAFLPSTWSPAASAAWSGSSIGGAALLVTAGNWALMGPRDGEGNDGALSNVTVYLGIFTVAKVFATALRGATDSAIRARSESVREAADLATQENRTLLHSALHRRTVDALSAIRKGWTQDRDLARSRARLEAARVRRFISTDGAPVAGGLQKMLSEVLEDQAPHDLNVEIQIEESAPCLEPVAGALCAGIRASLQNVRSHAGVSTVVVRVVADGAEVRAVIRDHGVGFEVPGLAWAPRSVLEAVNGILDVECRSEPGAGTRVVLRSRPM